MFVWKPLKFGAGIVLAISAMAVGATAFAADLPKTTQKILKEMKVDPSVLSGLDQELAVPQAWIDGAKKEGKVKILDNLSGPQFREMVSVFKERYPFLDVSYAQGTYQARTTKILVAFKAGNVPYDVITDFGGFYSVFEKNHVLADLRSLPTFAKVDPEMRADDGSWVGYRRQYWCTSYNTNLVKKSDLPDKWEDILTNPVWRNKHLAIGNRPQLWLLMLWNQKGADWAKDYTHRLFSEVKPQLRKEGMDTLPQLAAAGEFRMVIPTSEFQVAELQETGAPIGYHCPKPIPATVAMKGIVKGSPDPYAAKLYLNWLLSKEGQIMLAHVSHSIPVREDLQRRELVPFADEIIGKKIVFRSIKVIENLEPKVNKFWADAWIEAGGPVRKRHH